MPFSYDNLGSLETALDAHRRRVAAVALDVAGARAPSPGFVPGVARLAREHGALLIYDEIVTGFRLALGGAQEY